MGAFLYLAVVGAQTHRGAKILLFQNLFLLGHHIDHGLRGFGVKLGRGGVFQAADVAREFDGGQLHSQAQSQERYVMRAAELDGFDLSLHSPGPKPARNYDAVVVVQFL